MTSMRECDDEKHVLAAVCADGIFPSFPVTSGNMAARKDGKRDVLTHEKTKIDVAGLIQEDYIEKTS